MKVRPSLAETTRAFLLALMNLDLARSNRPVERATPGQLDPDQACIIAGALHRDPGHVEDATQATAEAEVQCRRITDVQRPRDAIVPILTDATARSIGVLEQQVDN